MLGLVKVLDDALFMLISVPIATVKNMAKNSFPKYFFILGLSATSE